MDADIQHCELCGGNHGSLSHLPSGKEDAAHLRELQRAASGHAPMPVETRAAFPSSPLNDKSYCYRCDAHHYGSTPCPYKPKESGEARTVRVRIAVAVNKDGAAVAAGTDKAKMHWTDPEKMLGEWAMLDGFESDDKLRCSWIEADVPLPAITAPATIRAEVVQ